ncbi:hypothetical protein FQN54_004285 [Arachnomyces sp. PD_36]|nr:hypothetical protein FQN54_004285 [Arachnomyces sp. PD_36]
MHQTWIAVAACALSSGLATAAPAPHYPLPQTPITNIQLGPRPWYLIDDMDDGELKQKLESCSEKPIRPSAFSISHRGGPLQFPEHTKEGMLAAARMGAGILECDVAFTKDRELVCRHSQCDLHTTTNILAIPELAAKCTTPFEPAKDGKPATAMCCTSDITLAEFQSLCGKMDASDTTATTPEDYLGGTPSWRTDLYAQCGTVVSHKDYIELVDSLGLKFTPELKTPQVKMPFEGDYTQAMYAQQLIDEYKEAHIRPNLVWAQSFLYDDIEYWLREEPAFARQAVYLDDRGSTWEGLQAAIKSLPGLEEQGLNIVAPPINTLLTVDDDNNIVPSEYAIKAKEVGLDIITWSLERSGPLKEAAAANDTYLSSFSSAITKDGDMYTIVDFLAQKVGVSGIFSDWPATVTYYANCFRL